MKILADTPVWSAALRRASGAVAPVRVTMEKLVRQGLVELIGAIRQELLSGIRERAQFERVRDQLRSFPDIPIETEDYEEAADCFNRCRKKGIQGSATDFLICAVAIRHDLAIYTDDRDFTHYAKVLPVRLYTPA